MRPTTSSTAPLDGRWPSRRRTHHHVPLPDYACQTADIAGCHLTKNRNYSFKSVLKDLEASRPASDVQLDSSREGRTFKSLSSDNNVDGTASRRSAFGSLSLKNDDKVTSRNNRQSNSSFNPFHSPSLSKKSRDDRRDRHNIDDGANNNDGRRRVRQSNNPSNKQHATQHRDNIIVHNKYSVGSRQSSGYGKGREFVPSNFVQLEKRTVQHIDNFPHNQNLIPQWHSTSIELILEWSKFWGKNRQSNNVSPSQLYEGVSLADKLLHRVLSIKQRELDSFESTEAREEPIPETSIIHKNKSKALDTETLCDTVALGWSRCDANVATDAAMRAQRVLDRLEAICFSFQKLPSTEQQKVSFRKQDVTPRTKLYNHVLSSWARSLSSNAEASAKQLLDRMSSSRGTFAKTDVISYNNMLSLYANKGNVEKAKELLKEMEQPDHEIAADIYSYSIVMNAMLRRFVSSGPSRDMNDPRRAEELLSRLVTKHEQSGFKESSVMPNDVTFGTVLTMYAKADQLLREEYHKKGVRKWRDRDITPQTIGWGAENAERVLDWLTVLYERQQQEQYTNSDGIVSKRTSGEKGGMKLNSQHFLTVIDAWAKAGKGVEGAKRCERLCDRLVSLYQKSGGDAELRPRPQVGTKT